MLPFLLYCHSSPHHCYFSFTVCIFVPPLAGICWFISSLLHSLSLSFTFLLSSSLKFWVKVFHFLILSPNKIPSLLFTKSVLLFGLFFYFLIEVSNHFFSQVSPSSCISYSSCFFHFLNTILLAFIHMFTYIFFQCI